MMFNQKALLAALVLGTSTVALANGGSFAPVPAPHHTGAFYIGAGVSIDMAQFETNFNTSSTDFFFQPSEGLFRHTNFDWNGQGVDGDLYVGYNMVFEDRYTLGIELFGLISSLKGDYNHSFAFVDALDPSQTSFGGFDQGSVKMNYTLGVALLPGVKMTESTTLYARVGYVNSRFETDLSHNVFLNVPFAFSESTTVATSGHKNKGGIQLGVGVQTMVTNNVAIRLEGDWERYGTVDLDNAVAAVTPITNQLITLNNASIKPTVQSAKLSAIYMFNAA